MNFINRTCARALFVRTGHKRHINSIAVSNNLCGGEQKLILTPNNNEVLTWYSCGPTVYDDAHIGHARTYICTDIIRRIIVSYFGQRTNFAMGMTDIDDKIIFRSNEKNLNWKQTQEMVRKLEMNFFSDLDQLNILRPTVVLRVTEHMDEIITYISDIMKLGCAYQLNDGVYFDVVAYGIENYGRLGHLAPETCVGDESVRNVPTGKKHPIDFALWKLAKPGEPRWNSPWGEGRPGWHIECSAMTHSYFGSNLDMHSGGIDLKFPHHTNEIAQCEAHNAGKPWVRYWLHTGHLYIEGLKMSKSLKNFISIQDYLSSGCSACPADDLRIYCLQHKYHSALHFSSDRIVEASRVRLRVEELLTRINQLQGLSNPQSRDSKIGKNETAHYATNKPTAASKALMDKLWQFQSQTRERLCDDFDTPAVLTALALLITDCNMYIALNRTTDSMHISTGAYGTNASDDGSCNSDSIGGEEARVCRVCDTERGSGMVEQQPLEPLLMVRDHVLWLLRDVFGLSLRRVAGGRGSCGEVGGADSHAATTAFVQLRAQMRAVGLKHAKLHKQKQKRNSPEKEQNGTGGETDMDCHSELLELCDQARDLAKSTLAIQIEDSGNDFSGTNWRRMLK